MAYRSENGCKLVYSGMWLRDAEGKEHVSQSDRNADIGSYKTHFVCANPLPVYTETDKFVEPLDVKATIRGALVEVQFDLHHYCIRSKLQDSFNATMVQILVIQPGKAEPVLSNKRKNVRNGPVCLNPLSAKQKKTTDEDEPVAGSSTERSRTAPNDVNVLEGKQPKQVASQPSAPSDIVSKPGTAQNSGMVTYEITLNREELTGKCDNSTPHSL